MSLRTCRAGALEGRRGEGGSFSVTYLWTGFGNSEFENRPEHVSVTPGMGSSGGEMGRAAGSPGYIVGIVEEGAWMVKAAETKMGEEDSELEGLRDCPDRDGGLELGAVDGGLSGCLWMGHPRLQPPFPAGGPELHRTGWRTPPSVQAAEN